MGNKGMLGNAVLKFFNSKEGLYLTSTVEERWGDPRFETTLKKSDADIIVNCIGLIPQKNTLPEEYEKVNVLLPIFLESLGKNVIHPSTDCEFSGNIKIGSRYAKNGTRDATDPYGMSKSKISQMIEASFINTKIIRTSIVGHELKTKNSLLEWFLNSESSVKGFSNHYWNGITTLEWAKLCERLILSWKELPNLNQYGLEENISKSDLLTHIKKIYCKKIEIIPTKQVETCNKCLESDIQIPSIVDQLMELKGFYNK